jgi:hypothetical protein
MDRVLIILVALVPALTLFFMPRRGLLFVAIGTGLLALFFAIWSWHLNGTCRSDGCIGAGMMSGFTLFCVILWAIAGASRWAIIAVKNHRDNGWDHQ